MIVVIGVGVCVRIRVMIGFATIIIVIVIITLCCCFKSISRDIVIVIVCICVNVSVSVSADHFIRCCSFSTFQKIITNMTHVIRIIVHFFHIVVNICICICIFICIFDEMVNNFRYFLPFVTIGILYYILLYVHIVRIV